MQQEFFGFDSIKKLKELFNKYEPRHVFLVTGKKSFRLSGTEDKVKSLLGKIRYTQFNEFAANPDIREVKQGINLFKSCNPDIVVGIGGGSALDMAKTVNVLADHSEKIELYTIGKTKLEKPGRPLIAIPTTSGTGSEATYFATIYIGKKKYSIGDKALTLPTVSIVDPYLTESMPKYLTASTGLDALCQGIESLWAVDSTEESRRYAKKAVKIVVNTIEKAVNNPDKESRLNMAKAAHLSGKAINISKTTSCHSISYPITSYFGISHGHAVALTIPQLIEFNSRVSEKDCNDKRGENFVKARIKEIIGLLDAEDAVGAKRNFQTLMKKIGVEDRLGRLNIDYNGSRLIIDNGFTPDRMNNNPRVVIKDDLEKIMDEIL